MRPGENIDPADIEAAQKQEILADAQAKKEATATETEQRLGVGLGKSLLSCIWAQHLNFKLVLLDLLVLQPSLE